MLMHGRQYIDMMNENSCHELEIMHATEHGIFAFYMHGNIASSRVWVHSDG